MDNFVENIRNFIETKSIVDFEEENEVFTIDTFDILNVDNHPVMTDNIIIKEVNDKIEIDFISNEKKSFNFHREYNKKDIDIEELFNEIYEEIVFLNFFGQSREDYILSKVK